MGWNISSRESKFSSHVGPIAINAQEKVTKSIVIFAYLWMRSPREGNFWIDLKRKERRNHNHTYITTIHISTSLVKHITFYAIFFLAQHPKSGLGRLVDGGFYITHN